MLRDVYTRKEPETGWFDEAMPDQTPGHWLQTSFQASFQTWFQPVVDTRGHQITGQECLIRFAGDRDRTGNEILRAARSRNQLEEFDSCAVRLAIRSSGIQREEGRGKGPWFINFIPSAITDPGAFVRNVLDALAEASMEPGDIVFEVVESDITGDSARLRAIHDRLRGHGFLFSLDNTGIGANAFQMVCDLRPDYIKIDRRLSWNAEQPFCATTIRKLVELADLNGVQPVAAGVERARTAENLWLLGVQLMQGYLFGRPSVAVNRCSSRSDLEHLAKALSPTSEALAGHHPTPAFSDLH